MPLKSVQKFRDRNLFSRLKKKDQEAFVAAYDLYVSDINRFIFFKVNNREEANDLTSIVFLKAWDYIKTNNLSDSRTLKALFYKIARTTVVDYYRERHPLVSIDDEQKKIDVVDEQVDISGQADLKIDLDLITTQLAELKAEYREIIILRFINELELDEIADITGKSRGNLRVLTWRALKALRELVSEAQIKSASESTNQESSSAISPEINDGNSQDKK